MSRNDYKWFLVQWNDGGFDVVHVRSLVNALHEQLNAGAAVMAIVKGERKAGILVSKSYDRNILDQILGKAKNVETEQDRDFSPSGSSWEPSDEDCASDSDEENEKENNKRVRFDLSNLSKKSCTNETPKRRILTPSHRANAVIPESMKKDKNVSPNNSSRKRTFPVACNSNDKGRSPQDLNGNKREITLNKVTIDLEQIEAMSNCFEYVLKKIKQMRSPFSRVSRTRDWPTYNVNIKHDDVNIPADHDLDNENDRSGSAESNRSDDNVLITNKFSIVNNSTSEDQNELAKVPKLERVSTDNAETKEYHNKKYSKNVEKSSTSKNVTKHKATTVSEDEWVSIGSGKTLIHKDKFRTVNWKSYTIATRTLLLALFPRRTLATHSLTGKKSPAFQNKPAKMCLDPKIISDIIMEVKDRFNVKENLIRSIITTKCADECKMYKARRQKKKLKSGRTEKESILENVVVEDTNNKAPLLN